MNLRLRRPLRILGCCLAVCSVTWFAGCGARGLKYPSTRLEGTVTVNQRPLTEGSLQFMPQGKGQGPAVGGFIKDGHYAVNGVPLGDVRVLFIAVRKTHQLPKDETGRESWATENLIPEPSRGGVAIQVTAGQSVQDFKL